jgi:hypothetical protein
MIQRIQTLYLALAAVAAVLLLFLPVVAVGPSAEGGTPDPVRASEAVGALVAALAMAAVALGAIFLYGNRPLQARLGGLGIVAALAFAGLLAGGLAGELDRLRPLVGAALPLLYLLFVALAIRGIRADERLVKSMDRFR